MFSVRVNNSKASENAAVQGNGRTFCRGHKSQRHFLRGNNIPVVLGFGCVASRASVARSEDRLTNASILTCRCHSSSGS